MNNYEKLEQVFGSPAATLEASRSNGFKFTLAHYENAGRRHFTLNVIGPAGQVHRTFWYHADEGKGSLPPVEKPVDVDFLRAVFNK